MAATAARGVGLLRLAHSCLSAELSVGWLCQAGQEASLGSRPSWLTYRAQELLLLWPSTLLLLGQPLLSSHSRMRLPRQQLRVGLQLPGAAALTRLISSQRPGLLCLCWRLHGMSWRWC